MTIWINTPPPQIVIILMIANNIDTSCSMPEGEIVKQTSHRDNL